MSVPSVVDRHDVTDHGHDCRGRKWLCTRRCHRTPIQSEGKRKDYGKHRLSHPGIGGESVARDRPPKRPHGRCHFSG